MSHTLGQPTAEARAKKQNRRRASDAFTHALLLFLVAALGLVAYEALEELRLLKRNEQARAAAAIMGAEERIANYLRTLRSEVKYLALAEHELIATLRDDPDNHALADELRRRVTSHLPLAFATTIADHDGTPVLADFDGLVSGLCEQSIEQFAHSGGDYQLRIHPNPFGHHFDIMVRLPADPASAERRAVFFVSFLTDRIAKILRDSSIQGYQLALLFAPDPSLIEIAPQGPRSAMNGDFRLNDSDTNRITASQPVAGTQWVIASLAEEGHLRDRLFSLGLRHAGYLLAIILLTAYVLHAMRRQKDYQQELQRLVSERSHQLHQEQARSSAVLANAFDAVVIADPSQRITLFNPAAERLFGYRADEVIGKPLGTLLPEQDRARHQHYVDGFGAGETHRRPMGSRPEVHGRRKNGEIFPAEAGIFRMELDGATHFGAFVRDITTRKRIERRIRDMALTDAVTQLGNRHHFYEQIDAALDSQRRDGKPFALLLIDLDRFKPVNDAHGHLVGDQLLQCLGERLQRSFRDEDTVSRIGGDEFGIILAGVGSAHDAKEKACEVVKNLSAAVTLGETVLEVGASVGISLCPRDGSDRDTLMERADRALYSVKKSGRNGVALHGD